MYALVKRRVDLDDTGLFKTPGSVLSISRKVYSPLCLALNEAQSFLN